jgi:hypothetical protein
MRTYYGESTMGYLFNLNNGLLNKYKKNLKIEEKQL